MSKKEASKDLYQEVTDQIVTALENGVVPWVKPWDGDKAALASGMPVNAATNRPYHGVNVMLLWMREVAHGYSTSRWMTFKQAKDAGGSVRKGEKSTLAVFFKPIQRQKTDRDGKPVTDEKGEPVMKTVPILRAFKLFNVDQIDDLEDRYRVGPTGDAPEPSFTPIEAAESVLESSGALIRHGGARAFYSPELDYIQLPPKASFREEAGYYATALHELTHWTGHESRLAREGIVEFDHFGSERYAFEELVAELGAAFLCAEIGIQGDLRHEGYIGSWVRKLKEDKRAIFRAASQARKAAEHLRPEAEVQSTETG